MNELLLILSLVLIYGAVLFAYMVFGRSGLYCMSAIVTIFANVEVLILINAFGMEQTLGNLLFAATFLITDILSECEGKRAANKAVYIGLFATLFFLALSQSWLMYVPSDTDFAMPSFAVIFSQTPRMILASLVVFVVSQFFDVWLYHKWWSFTQKKFGDSKRFLWLRNNGSTLVSQLINSALFTVCAFAGSYSVDVLFSLFGMGYIIFIFTSLLDTPILYLARRFKKAKIESGKTLLGNAEF